MMLLNRFKYLNRSRALVAVLASTLAACGDSGTEPLAVVSVNVIPSSGALDVVGASVQFQAFPKDVTGGTVSGQSVTWASSDTGVATISATGLATAVAPGTAAITATVAGVAGSAVLTVNDPAQACLENLKTVALPVGGTQTFEGSDCIVLPAGVSGDRYRVAVVRPATSGTETDVVTATLKVLGLGVTQAPEPSGAPSLVALPPVEIAGLSEAAIRKAMRVAEATERFHLKLRSQDAALAREAGYDLLPSRPSGTLQRLVAKAPSPAKMVFEVTAGTTCAVTAGNRKTGLLISENDDLAIYQDSTENATKPVSVGLAQKMTTFFSAYVKDMIPQYWGNVSDIDGNGKIIVLASPKATDDVAAFVWSGDFYPTATCAASNAKELVYFNTDLILGMEDASPTYQALETLAHETKHVVSLYSRIAATRRTSSDQFQPSWIEEGTAEIAGEMSSRLAWAATGGPSLNAAVDGESFKVGGKNTITPENYGVAIHLARTAWYLSSQPNGLVISPTDAVEGHSVYGSGWLFHRWLGDAYGGAASAPMAEASLFKALTDSLNPAGTVGLSSQTGTSFLNLYQEFVNAIALHRTAAPEPGKHFTTYDFVTAAEIFCNPNPVGVFPWPVTTNGTAIDCAASPPVREVSTATATFKTATYSGPMGITGIRIHDFVSNGSGTGAQITLTTGGQPAKMQVVRLR
ncbi:MAG TPA: Ig-like domain-containing protein [Longimicrobiales bacterium]|nr:Ig-like domain-containing protein [Longimicrobiales bacterium]